MPTVGAIHLLNGYNENELLTYAAAAEDYYPPRGGEAHCPLGYKQTHPIARAITNSAKKRGLTVPKVSDATYSVGYGLKVKVSQKPVYVGSGRFMEMCAIPMEADIKKIEEHCHWCGHSLVYIAIDNQLAGAIELHPTIRPEAQQLISQLHQRNIDTYIISGDTFGKNRLKHSRNHSASSTILPKSYRKIPIQLRWAKQTSSNN